MKKLLFILFLTLSLSVEAQRSNSMYVIVSPNDMGMGLRYDRAFKTMGIYTSLSKGHYQFANGGVDKHYKMSLGALVFNNSNFINEDYIFLSGGLTYHIYRGVWYPEGYNTNVFDPLGLEIGAGIVVNAVSFAFTCDVVKWDAGLCFGIKF